MSAKRSGPTGSGEAAALDVLAGAQSANGSQRTALEYVRVAGGHYGSAACTRCNATTAAVRLGRGRQAGLLIHEAHCPYADRGNRKVRRAHQKRGRP